MFIRAKKRGTRTYLQIVENERVGSKVVQHVKATLGRLDILQETGQLDSLLRSGLRFSQKLLVLDAHKNGAATSTRTRKIGIPFLFERLWKDTGIKTVVNSLIYDRKFQFPLERVLFATVLHRLVAPGSDRAAEKWIQSYAIDGLDSSTELQHFYRTMGWLGEALPEDHQNAATPFMWRANKDRIEEGLFALRQDLFTKLDIVFFDTTSLHFEGKGGSHLGHRGFSKNHRSDLNQVVVGVVIDNRGNPLCSEIMPGNTTDVKTLIPIAERLKKQFGVQRICIVADRGMISKETIRELEQLDWDYILGVRMHKVVEVRDTVLLDKSAYDEIYPERITAHDPAPLEVKELTVDDRRYIICSNEEEVRKDRYDRDAIVAALREQLKQGDKSLVGNKGYRRYLKSAKGHFEIDEEKLKCEERFDGKWVLRTNTDMDKKDVALKYKQLLMVEDIFRTMKSILDTRPVFHKCDDNISGHVFCSFLALVLRKALQDRIDAKKWKLEWADIVRDVDAIEEVEITHENKQFIIRNEVSGVAGKALQAAGVALPPVLRELKTCGTTPEEHP
jgi:transposase